MKKTIKYLSLLLAMLFIISGTVMIVSATGDDGSGDYSGDGSGDYSGDGSGDYSGDGSGDNSGDGSGDYSGDGSGDYSGDGSGDYTGEDPNAGSDDYSGDGSGDYSGDGSGETPADDPGYIDDSPMWYGDASDYDYNSGNTEGNAGKVSDSTKLFDTSDADSIDVAPNTWSNIAIDSKEVNSNSTGSFKAIKESGPSATDESAKWMIWLGIALIFLSVLGIIYFIAATVSAKNRNKREERHNGGNHPGGGSRGYTESAPRSAERSAAPRSAETYSSPRRQPASRHASKADTAEIYIPRRATK